MIKDFFINTIKILSREEIVSYQDGIPQKTYKEKENLIACRVGHLNSKDLQFLSKTADISVQTRKLFTDASCPLKLKDEIVRQGDRYQVIYAYAPQTQTWEHHKKFFIQLVQ